jgi:hypothetical protein
MMVKPFKYSINGQFFVGLMLSGQSRRAGSVRSRLHADALLSYIGVGSFPLESAWRNGHYDDQTRNDEREGHKRHQNNAAS